MYNFRETKTSVTSFQLFHFVVVTVRRTAHLTPIFFSTVSSSQTGEFGVFRETKPKARSRSRDSVDKLEKSSSRNLHQ